MNKLNVGELKKEKTIFEIPDGSIYVKRINDKLFDYRIQLNDVKIPFYHRSNGVTKTRVWNPNKGKHGAYGWVKSDIN